MENPYRSYTVNFKLRVLSYSMGARIRECPIKERELTRIEVVQRFKIPATNLYRWKKEEKKGKFAMMKGEQRRMKGGGRGRMWPEMERELFEKFQERRALGTPVRRGWFRKVSRELFLKHYPRIEGTPCAFTFSNGWVRLFLSWHQISLRFATNKQVSYPLTLLIQLLVGSSLIAATPRSATMTMVIRRVTHLPLPKSAVICYRTSVI